jgi:homoserine kinase
VDRSPFTVHVPATAANLGPGFDCLGLSLDMWSSVNFYFSDSPNTVSIRGEGEHMLPKGPENLIYSSAVSIAKHIGRELPSDLRLKSINNVPISSGLGSSAAAIISGILGADKILNTQLSKSEILNFAKSIEGHADNISACLLGGLVLVQDVEGSLQYRTLGIKPLTAVVVVPDFNMSTADARKALPDSYSREDVIITTGNSILLIESLRTGDYKYLRNAMEDKIHQPYRLPLLDGAESAIKAAYEAGAVGSCLSGAGPSVIAFTDSENSESVKDAMVAAYRLTDVTARSFIVKCPSRGAFID